MKISIEMPLDETRYFRLKEYQERQQLYGSAYNGKDRDYTLFQSCGVSFVLIHGNPQGYVQYRGQLITPAQLLHCLLPAMKKQGITEIKTLSCFGGLQQAAEEEGYRISSFHTSSKEIFHMMTMDGVEFTFDFTEEEINSMPDIPDGMTAYRVR